jgi:cation diffusion facilitator CzcD-associated flavoprotein CzcO
MNTPLKTSNPHVVIDTDVEVLEVAVVGTGFAGLGMGIRLKKAGITNFRIFEKASDIGGTWRDNTYPGCGCDIKSQLYSYSYEPYAQWSNVYATQGQIHEYIRHCARKYGMYPYIAFNSGIVGAAYDEQRGEWRLEIEGGRSVRAKSVVAAPGPFSAPADPHIAGTDSFLGERIQTANWRHDVDLKGKRVGLIGTGATAVQVGPAIVDQLQHLTVFQRTPNWIMPRMDREISAREKTLIAKLPIAMKAARLSNYWLNELTAPFLILKYDAFKQHPEGITRRYLERKVKDPILRQKLTPDYKFGCKRVLVSSDWFPTLQRPDVSLVTAGIQRITPNGIVTADGIEHALDVIIFATGYQVRHTGAPFAITGLNGQLLNDKWKNGAEAYNGITTGAFPNLYFLVGPFTGPGHTSVIAYAEAQIDYVWQAIEFRRQKNLKAIEVKPEVEQRFVDIMDRRSEHTVWKSGCSNWYLSPNGRNNTLYPGFNAEYRMRIMRFNPADYRLTSQTGHTVIATLKDHLNTGLMAIKTI